MTEAAAPHQVTCPTCRRAIVWSELPFGGRLRLLREARGWTKSAAAARCELPLATYGTHEARDEYPHAGAVRKLATGFGVDEAFLLGIGAGAIGADAAAAGEECP